MSPHLQSVPKDVHDINPNLLKDLDMLFDLGYGPRASRSSVLLLPCAAARAGHRGPHESAGVRDEILNALGGRRQPQIILGCEPHAEAAFAEHGRFRKNAVLSAAKFDEKSIWFAG